MEGGGENPFAAAPPPPISQGPLQVESWAAQLAALAVGTQGDPERTLWLLKQVRALGRMADRARKSWKAAQVLREYEGAQLDPAQAAPPTDPRALCAWAYFRLALAIHEGATAAVFDEVRPILTLRIEAAATQGYVAQQEAIVQLAEAVKCRMSGRKGS